MEELNLDLATIATFLSLLIGIIGLIFAYFEYRKRAELKEHMRTNNWMYYHRADNTNGTIQLVLKLYKTHHAKEISPEVLEQLSKADAFGQELFKETIRQFAFIEPSFTKFDFERWKNEGKLTEDKVKLFMRFSPDTKY